MTGARKGSKGSIGVSSDRGWLRLQWSYQKQRYRLNLGVADTPAGRGVAQQKARLIEADIAAEQFDKSLAKYQGKTTARLTVAELFERYTDWKRKSLEPESLQKYHGLQGHLQQFFRNKLVEAISEKSCFDFKDWLIQRQQPITARERIGMLRSCWSWAVKRRLAEVNPWSDVRVKVPTRLPPRPFTLEEVDQILRYARSCPQHQPYSDFIEFCLAIGCRPGEAAGLKWQALTDDCGAIWVGESWGRGRQKSTKTNQSRSFGLTSRLRAMLLARRPEDFTPGGYVFLGPKGGAIDDHNFRRRCWRPMLEALGIPYRMPRRSRATFISHAIDQGHSVSEIAAITGNSVETILRNYVGNPRGRSQLWEMFKPDGGSDADPAEP